MKKLYLIGNAHLDPVWLWQWQEGYSEVLATFRSALDRMKDFSDFKFTSACSIYYQWVEETDPEMFKEIQARVKEGRWNIVGGMLLQPDCNLPSGESFARHALLAQRYFKEKFGIIAKTGYNVDSFGHNRNLPKILKSAGMENYVFMRPSPYEKPEIEDSLFWWEADDGSKVCAYRIPQPYNINGQKSIHRIKEIQALAQEEERDLMAFYGVGNHGGGPTIKLIEEIKAMDLPDAVFATVDEYFGTIEKTDLSTVSDELQHHARGCYSAYADIKSGNRKSEQNLLAAERFCLMAKELTGTKYPKDALKKAWENTLFNQFHDILGGCSIEKAYEDAKYLHHETMAITERVINDSLQKIAWNIDTLGDETLPGYLLGGGRRIWEHEKLGTPFIVFNPHAWPVRQMVSTYASARKVEDSEGREIPFQRVRADNNIAPSRIYHTAFMAEVPAMGYRVYRLFMEQKSALPQQSPMKIGRTYLENDLLRVEFDEQSGDISKIYDKEQCKFILTRPCRAIHLDESLCDTWAHDVVYLGPEIEQYKNADFMIIEEGAMRVTLRSTAYCGSSSLQRDFTLHLGEKRVNVSCKAGFYEKSKTLKLAFPMEGDLLTVQIPYGSHTRNGETGEEFCGAWITDSHLAIANDGKYGVDAYKGEMRLTILRGAAFADHCRVRSAFCNYMDQGEHPFSYTIAPFENISKAERQAAELNSPLRTIKGTFHKGNLSEKFDGISALPENIMVSAIKEAEDGEGNILRLFEMEGKEAAATIKLFGKEYHAKLLPHALKTISSEGELNLLEWDE